VLLTDPATEQQAMVCPHFSGFKAQLSCTSKSTYKILKALILLFLLTQTF
jgi:hypothetical protein